MNDSASNASQAAAAGYVGWTGLKAAGITAALGAGFAAVVVMCLLTPRNPKEWAVGLITTVLSSVCGGAYIILKYELVFWMDTVPGLLSVLGLVFACGLPGWAVVRWVFTFVEKRKDHDIGQIYDEVRLKWWGGQR